MARRIVRVLSCTSSATSSPVASSALSDIGGLASRHTRAGDAGEHRARVGATPLASGRRCGSPPGTHPAGGRAVAGSNPVSSMRSSCKLGCSQGHSNLCCGVQIGGGVQFLRATCCGVLRCRGGRGPLSAPGRPPVWSAVGECARGLAHAVAALAGTTSALVAAEGDCNGRDAVPDVAFLTTRRRLASSDRRGSCRRRQGRAAATTDRPPGCGSTLVERPYERVRAVEHAVGIRVPHPQVERDQVGVPEGERGAAVGALGRA
jgi:hypothetical protein